MKPLRLGTILLSALLFWACSGDDEPQINSDNFDRGAMLINWADNIIIPGYKAYTVSLKALNEATVAFNETSSVDDLVTLRSAWLEAYISWQMVSMFEIGKAEAITLRDFTNIYPTNAETIESNILTGDYNLELPSSRVAQGFPAIDYLINGLASDDALIADKFSQNPQYGTYLSALTSRLNTLAETVLEDWSNGYRETFIANDGSSATSSVNKLINDYMLYYEKFLRAGKVGIPAGVFSNTPLSDNVEAYHKNDVSKVLLITALDAVRAFFNGDFFDGSSSGQSLDDYLNFVHENGSSEDLVKLINNQFDLALSKASTLSNSFSQQIESNNQEMLSTYDALQTNVVLMKVDMFQALNIKVDFVDADGD
ncbi:imelysin family protein [Fulvivirga lutimaris]|uniref:imelysin family protein n=1 Tax=Fulvivirga lutimaris TaxID=1819566 RepID=UPI0012BBB4D4|nr:imelysin family protein [Fulvivirga lutimaris]MTI39026.1 peptidase M75 superfamily protein [Fulvivirga lutimaris]